MRKLADKFPGAVFVFATLKDALSDAEKALICPLASWGRENLPDHRPRAPVIVLTGIELFARWHIEEAWEEHGGMHANFAAPMHQYLGNLATLANLTQQLYLGLPDRYAELRASMAGMASRPPEGDI